MNSLASIWFSDSGNDWKSALNQYWIFVRPENLVLEKSMEQINLHEIAELDAEGWYRFLHDRYFKWKFTARNRYRTTTMQLKKYQELKKLNELNDIKKRLLSLDIQDIHTGLSTAKEIKGLGIAGASGLLALMYPTAFATVDQFVVKTLRNITKLPEYDKVSQIKEDNIKIREGDLLIRIMRRKSQELNQKFSTDFWTPRKLDMVLWGAR